MLRSLNSLKKLEIFASDGKIGHIDGFLFDDEKWAVRYFVVNTGGWLKGKKVLVSPLSVESMDASTHTFRVFLTKQQIENSPDIDSDKPVSRQMESDYHDYYRWPYYWMGSGAWGMASYPGGMLGRPFPLPTQPSEYSSDISENEGDPHLRSADVIEGYQIAAKDNLFGEIEDFIIDEISWKIRYLVINTARFWFEKPVLISPDWVTSISWEDRSIIVDLLKEEIKNSPAYNPRLLITPEYESKLVDHYRGSFELSRHEHSSKRANKFRRKSVI
jgi:uncharacterized protein YrrD